jgi:hypothetical protein
MSFQILRTNHTSPFWRVDLNEEMDLTASVWVDQQDLKHPEPFDGQFDAVNPDAGSFRAPDRSVPTDTQDIELADLIDFMQSSKDFARHPGRQHSRAESKGLGTFHSG